MWYRDLKKLQDAGKIQLVGLIQEQHPDRCRLFMEWKKLDFPILVDSLNRLGVTAIPKIWALADQSLVIETRPKMDWIRGEFLELVFPAMIIENPEPKESRGVAHYLNEEWSKAIDNFSADLNRIGVLRPKDGSPYFRLGCAYMARHDSMQRKPRDFQEAIHMWTRAVALDPGNYIYRRRLQQYGPRLDKPYPFYGWVAQARREIRARGDALPELSAEPRGSELAGPSRQAIEASKDKEPNPDPKRKMPLDEKGYVRIESVIAPYPAQAGKTVAVHMDFRLNKKLGTTWDNEGGPLEVWLEKATGVKIARQRWKSPLPGKAKSSKESSTEASSTEKRSYDFEIELTASKNHGKATIKGFAIYFVCEKESGICTFARQDFEIQIPYLRTRKRTEKARR